MLYRGDHDRIIVALMGQELEKLAIVQLANVSLSFSSKLPQSETQDLFGHSLMARLNGSCNPRSTESNEKAFQPYQYKKDHACQRKS